MSDVDTGSDDIGGEYGGEDESALYAEMETNLAGGEEVPEEAGEEEDAKPKRAPLPPEETARRLEQKTLALRQERQRARAAEARQAELEERLAAVERRASGAAVADDDDFDIPDPVEDPIAALEALKKLAGNLTAAQKKERQDTQQSEAQAKQFRQIATRMNEYEDDFRATTPDYDKAAEHFRKSRTEDLTEQGYSGDELNRALSTEFIGLVTRTLQAGKDPAEVVYALAKRRGYGLDKASKTLQTLKNGQAAGSAIHRGGGTQGEGGKLTAADVSKLSGKPMLEAFAKLRAQERGR